jgi:putative redox protein
MYLPRWTYQISTSSSGEIIVSRTIIVTGKPPGLCQVISIGPHKLLADEAMDAASNDEGPDPYEYLLASLGTCINMTLRMYADHKAWPLKQIETTLSHFKNYAADCEHCAQPAAMIDYIESRITLFGELSHEQRKRLLEIANRCPVHRTLTSKIEIHSALESGGES